ncbi:uncharacterized protein LOC120216477 [Hibiscus syriacus]|uniref:uncharacterized protein LOC120216477 n=1 Tax=Hibiscus syriacus TaxID=106335 RepID=UPI00192146CF|nr:uncharacterized protein LOC120216477 [Hibiscus syriacus]
MDNEAKSRNFKIIADSRGIGKHGICPKKLAWPSVFALDANSFLSPPSKNLPQPSPNPCPCGLANDRHQALAPHLHLKFVSSINTHRFQDPRRLLPVRFKPMATKLEDTPMKGTGDDNNKGGKVEEPAEAIPPPPEKPEPGDCCGSGCVRCVWDVYYEELEAYNKLYKSDPKDSTPNSS